jgi:hypothetical protein
MRLLVVQILMHDYNLLIDGIRDDQQDEIPSLKKVSISIRRNK